MHFYIKKRPALHDFNTQALVSTKKIRVRTFTPNIENNASWPTSETVTEGVITWFQKTSYIKKKDLKKWFIIYLDYN